MSKRRPPRKLRIKEVVKEVPKYIFVVPENLDKRIAEAVALGIHNRLAGIENATEAMQMRARQFESTAGRYATEVERLTVAIRDMSMLQQAGALVGELRTALDKIQVLTGEAALALKVSPPPPPAPRRHKKARRRK